MVSEQGPQDVLALDSSTAGERTRRRYRQRMEAQGALALALFILLFMTSARFRLPAGSTEAAVVDVFRLIASSVIAWFAVYRVSAVVREGGAKKWAWLWYLETWLALAITAGAVYKAIYP